MSEGRKAEGCRKAEGGGRRDEWRGELQRSTFNAERSTSKGWRNGSRGLDRSKGESGLESTWMALGGPPTSGDPTPIERRLAAPRDQNRSRLGGGDSEAEPVGGASVVKTSGILCVPCVLWFTPPKRGPPASGDPTHFSRRLAAPRNQRRSRSGGGANPKTSRPIRRRQVRN